MTNADVYFCVFDGAKNNPPILWIMTNKEVFVFDVARDGSFENHFKTDYCLACEETDKIIFFFCSTFFKIPQVNLRLDTSMETVFAQSRKWEVL